MTVRYKKLLTSKLAVKVVRHLDEWKTVGMLSKELNRGYTTISDVVYALHREGLVKKVKRGKEVYYRLDRLKLKRWLNKKLNEIRKEFLGFCRRKNQKMVCGGVL